MNFKKLVFPVLAVLTLGLAPYYPEPHFFGKLRWLLGGAEGMQALDYFDLALHGAPWVLLVYRLVEVLIKSINKQKA